MGEASYRVYAQNFHVIEHRIEYKSVWSVMFRSVYTQTRWAAGVTTSCRWPVEEFCHTLVSHSPCTRWYEYSGRVKVSLLSQRPVGDQKTTALLANYITAMPLLLWLASYLVSGITRESFWWSLKQSFMPSCFVGKEGPESLGRKDRMNFCQYWIKHEMIIKRLYFPMQLHKQVSATPHQWKSVAELLRQNRTIS